MHTTSPLSRRAFLGAATAAGAGTLATTTRLPANTQVKPETVDEAVATAMKAWSVPGACVAVVHNDMVVHIQGYGVREVGTNKVVTPNTMFGIASCTKAFAAAAAAVLVDDKKLGWDDPVRKHLPWFRMADPLAEREITLRDCLCHRTGLHDRDQLLYYMVPWSVEETVRRIAHLELGFAFRSTFHYCGLNYFIAAAVLSAAAGKPWHEFTRERLLTPLGMTEVAFTKAEWEKVDDRATTHLKTADGKVVVIPPWHPGDGQIDASGRLKASGRSMCEWLRMHLDGGKLNGKQLVSEANLGETHTPQMVIRRDKFWGNVFPKTQTVQSSYGLGWCVYDYRGQAVVAHGGATNGFRTETVLVPGSKLGFVILTNLDVQDNWLPEALMHTLIDLYLGLPKTDWNDHYLKIVRKNKEKAETEKKEAQAKQKKNTKPTLGLADYAGEYSEPAYKEVQVIEKAGKLWMKWNSFEAELKHFHFDTFTATGDGGVNVYNENALDGEVVVFVLNGEGQVGFLEWHGRRFKRVGVR